MEAVNEVGRGRQGASPLLTQRGHIRLMGEGSIGIPHNERLMVWEKVPRESPTPNEWWEAMKDGLLLPQ